MWEYMPKKTVQVWFYLLKAGEFSCIVHNRPHSVSPFASISNPLKLDQNQEEREKINCLKPIYNGEKDYSTFSHLLTHVYGYLNI